MTQPERSAGGGLPVVQRVNGFGDARTAMERELASNGVVLPIPQRANWQQAFDTAGTVMFVSRDAANRPVVALGAGISRSRALPRHRIYRVERWTGSSDADADRALLKEFALAMRRDRLCLRATIELFSFELDGREAHAEQLKQLGFVRAPIPRMYSQTLAIDLGPSEEELFAKLHSTARRHTRAPAKKGLALRPVTDPALGDRLEAIFNETFRRTGTVPEQHPWRKIIELSAAEPASSRIIGIFDDSVPMPDGLVAFAWGCVQGKYATYEAGASVRRPDLGNTPLSYAPLWDLITWAKRETPSTRFDLGGITSGGPNDPRHGISEFKRYFSDNLVQVGEEWTMEPAPLRASLARAISRGVRRANALRASASREEGVRVVNTPPQSQPAQQAPPTPSAPTT